MQFPCVRGLLEFSVLCEVIQPDGVLHGSRQYFFIYCYPFSFFWNAQTYTSLGHYFLVDFTNDTCVKSSMDPQAYKVVTTHDHEILGWKIISRLLHARSPHLWGMCDYVQNELSTLDFKQ